jgi:hypothetical protein
VKDLVVILAMMKLPQPRPPHPQQQIPTTTPSAHINNNNDVNDPLPCLFGRPTVSMPSLPWRLRLPIYGTIPSTSFVAWKSHDLPALTTNETVPLLVPVVAWPLDVVFVTMNVPSCPCPFPNVNYYNKNKVETTTATMRKWHGRKIVVVSKPSKRNAGRYPWDLMKKRRIMKLIDLPSKKSFVDSVISDSPVKREYSIVMVMVIVVVVVVVY